MRTPVPAQVTDAGLKQLAAFKNLGSLALEFTKVTDAGLKHLAVLKNLQRLDLRYTDVTDPGVRRLRTALPDCEIRPETESQSPGAKADASHGGKSLEKQPIDSSSIQELRSLPSDIATSVGIAGAVNSVAFSPDGDRIVSGSEDTTIKLWDAGTGEVLRTLTGHNADVRSVAFSPDGRRIVSASRDRTIKVWEAANGEELQTLTGHHDESIYSMAFSPDGWRIVSGSRGGTIKILGVHEQDAGQGYGTTQ